jgi:hypothetical protein
MYRLIVSDETFPAVLQKNERVQSDGIRSNSGNSYLSSRALFPLIRPTSWFGAHCGVAERNRWTWSGMTSSASTSASSSGGGFPDDPFELFPNRTHQYPAPPLGTPDHVIVDQENAGFLVTIDLTHGGKTVTLYASPCERRAST